ncbi:aminodeoxychorismate synthase component 1 [Vibrio olivae]|uniref:aminodeoxychorismate synthase n=1 Tax=Vibrio olivae TaxID=1243002 RepID=A0ABV5HI79_9VIBR
MNNNSQKPIQIKSLQYQRDLAVTTFSTIEHLNWAMLLRSASSAHIDSRFDILVANPLATLVTFGQQTTLTQDGQTTTSTEDPFTLLQQTQDALLGDIEFHQLDLPFVGGAVGYFAYDLGRRVESIPEIASHDINAPEMAIGLYNWALIVDHQACTAYIVGQDVEQHAHWLFEQVATPCAEFKLNSDWQSNMSPCAYADKFNSVQQYLHAGDCYQINLAQRFRAEYQGSEWQAYQALEAHNLAPFSAFIRLEDTAIISVSPERFIQLNQDTIETKPIKGTRPRSTDPVADKANADELANAPKDQAENLMIVDLLRNDIGRVATPSSVQVPKLFDIESFPAVHHLVSTIRAQLDTGYRPADLLRAAFPGGSITGAPKVRAMAIIEELEPHRRSAYCGSIGYISRHGHMDTSITIRTLVAHQNHLYAWAGGGVVADSQCDSEYQETLDKLSRILPILDQYR